MQKPKIQITYVGKRYISFKLDELSDGILIGYNTDKNGFTIVYRGDQLYIPLDITSTDIEKLNNPEGIRVINPKYEKGEN